MCVICHNNRHFVLRTRGANGEIAVNGVCACASKAAGRGGARYIRQHDDLRVHLTVYEAMSLAAALKLADFKSHEKKEKVNFGNH